MYTAIGAFTSAHEEEFKSLLPSCYSQTFSDCWTDRQSDMPNCDRINELFDIDDDAAVDIVGDMPFCEPVAIETIALYAGMAGVFGLGIGYLLGS